jgi:hypothetical protein
VVLHIPFQEYEQTRANQILKQFKERVEVQFLNTEDQQAFRMVQQYHPAWEQLTPRAKLFHACNYRIRVPHDYPPVLLTVALQGDRPQEQEFGYLLGRGLLIPSVLIRDLTPDEIKQQLDLYVKRPEEVVDMEDQTKKTTAVLEVWSKSEPPVELEVGPDAGISDPTSLLPVTRCTMLTLWEQAEELKEKFRRQEEANCPCCGQVTKLRKRKVTAAMARWLLQLIRVYLNNKRDWVVCSDHPELYIKGGDYAKLRFWGLIEHQGKIEVDEETDSYKKGSGIWRPTDKGIAYALGQVKINLHCYTYNNVVHHYSTEMVSIAEKALTAPGEYTRLIDGLETLLNYAQDEVPFG